MQKLSTLDRFHVSTYERNAIYELFEVADQMAGLRLRWLCQEKERQERATAKRPFNMGGV